MNLSQANIEEMLFIFDEAKFAIVRKEPSDYDTTTARGFISTKDKDEFSEHISSGCSVAIFIYFYFDDKHSILKRVVNPDSNVDINGLVGEEDFFWTSTSSSIKNTTGLEEAKLYMKQYPHAGYLCGSIKNQDVNLDDFILKYPNMVYHLNILNKTIKRKF